MGAAGDVAGEFDDVVRMIQLGFGSSWLGLEPGRKLALPLGLLFRYRN